MPIARVDIILFIADRNDWRKITLSMNACCEFFSWPKFLMTFFWLRVFLALAPRRPLGVQLQNSWSTFGVGRIRNAPWTATLVVMITLFVSYFLK